MSSQLSMLIYGGLILGLLAWDSRHRQGVSRALWLVVIWVAILGSKRISVWLNPGGGNGDMGNDGDGNSLDRNLFLFLLLAGLYVLKKRNVNWRTVIANNRWLYLFYLFFGISVIWSGFPLVAFKRWFKDAGNIVMILIILTESDPIQAIQAVFVRCAYILIPLSVLLIKSFPAVGRTYQRWTGTVTNLGVTTNKNSLGATVLILTLFLLWQMLWTLRKSRSPHRKTDLAGPFLVMVLCVWLLKMAHSATSFACAVLGSVCLIALSLNFVRKHLKSFLTLTFISAGILMLLSTVFDLKADVAEMLGRDPTLHGRLQIWQAVLGQGSNPLVGTGFNSFWLGDRAEQIQQTTHQYFFLNQAHNGYIEMYLNGGAIGLGLLLMTLFTAAKRIKAQLFVDPDVAGLRLVFLVAAMFHNWTEATFCRESPLWFVLLLVVFEYPRARAAAPAVSARPALATLPGPDSQTVPHPGGATAAKGA